MSLSRLRRNAEVSANIKDLTLRDKKSGKELASLYVKHDYFFMRTILSTENAYVTKTAKTAVILSMLLHRRIGYLGFSGLKQLIKAVNEINLNKSESLLLKCEVCSEAKLRSKPFGV